MRLKWTIDRCREEAYKSCVINNWLDDVCSHMIVKNMNWNYDLCKKEANKYKTRNEFKRKSCGAYTFSYRNGLLDEICSHMIRYKNNFKK